MDRPTHGLLDAIAAITSRRESGRLQITVPGSRGAFFFKDGKLVDARMGPFSGFPAVNHAISMVNADLKFDSKIQPPASTFIAINERFLLKERFGIETIGLEPVEGPTTETESAKPPVLISPQLATTKTESAKLPVPTTPQAAPPKTESAKLPVPTTPQAALPETESAKLPIPTTPQAALPETESAEMPIPTTPQAALPETESAKLPVPTTPQIALPETESAKLPVPTTPQIALPEKTIPQEARASHESVQQPAEGNVINRAGLRESKIRAARNRRAHRKESQRRLTANRFLNLAAEDARRKVEGENSATTSPAVTPEFTRSEKAGDTTSKSIYEERTPGESSGPLLTPEFGVHAERVGGSGSKSSTIETSEVAATKRCPKCNRVYEDFRNYCPYDSNRLVSESDISFNDAAKPEAGARHALLWTLLAISIVIGGILGYLLNSYLSRQPDPPASIEAQSEQNLNQDDDRPVIEGPLQGKEINLMKPEYSAIAKSEGVSGKVTVAIRVNKQGRVVSARALTGPRLLRVAAVAAARQSKFSPETLESRSSKNSGTITYTFK
jgi:TonB family protein